MPPPTEMRGGPPPVVGHRSGLLFDPRIKASGEDDPAATAAATSTTSNGLEIRLSACLACPPAMSYVRMRTDERPVKVPNVVAAHGDLLLIHMAIPCDGPFYCEVDWFVYRADPARPWLRRIPCDRILSRPAGIISLGDEFVVAELQLIRTFEGLDRAALAEGRSVDVKGLPMLELPYLFRYSSATDLCEHKPLAMPYDGDALKPFEWFTDKVLAADGSVMYWVDLHRGILHCDVAADCPELCFIRLPEIEIWKDIVDQRCTFPEVNRTVGICKGLVKFVDVDNGRFETRRLKTRFTVTTWVLNKIKMPAEWMKVAVLQVNDELWTLPNFRDSPLPRSAPLCPMVSAKDVRLFHFILAEDKHYRCQDWMITFNMHKKLLHSYECRYNPPGDHCDLSVVPANPSASNIKPGEMIPYPLFGKKHQVR
ncbi:uncharacterized protein LOC120649436 [Panicum virgatum]|uniref:DUF1618 domain-containing protein n=1 Tax=Panicum virgatum TaxID=38727 RepID=A0A8T0NA95_PANVG|nr:uncharacterized protein LOC120649436 [Panicum virgatum]KAG2545192.1 hypothetical protein PVAP13_9KG413916 [Panicum virgatum]